MARSADTYRAARRRKAREQNLIWRELPRFARTYEDDETIIVWWQQPGWVRV